MEHAERYPCQWRRTNEITLEDEYADSRVIALGQWIKMVATSSGSHHVPWMPLHISSCISSQL